MTEPNCPNCEGRGWTVEPDGGAGLARLCGCQHRPSAPPDRGETLEAVGCPPIYRETAFVEPQRWPSDELATWAGGPWSVLLWSREPGTGKSMFATELMWRVLAQPGTRGRPTTWLRAAQVPGLWFGSSGEAADDRERRAAAWARVMVAPAVLVDDLGRAHPGGGWEALTEVGSLRYDQKLPTLWTTNLSPDELAKQAPSLWDRLRTGLVVLVGGKSRRRR